MDTKLVEALYWKGVPVFDMGSHMSTVDVGWGSSAFHKMGREKVVLIDSVLPYGFELLMCDTDMVWLKVVIARTEPLLSIVFYEQSSDFFFSSSYRTRFLISLVIPKQMS